MSIDEIHEQMKECFLPTIANDVQKQIIGAFVSASLSGGGNEMRPGRFDSPVSSAQLAANTFGFFLNRPGDLLLPPEWSEETARKVFLEKELRFPWSGGRHPWLDVVIQTPSSLIAVEAKRYEPFRGAKKAEFSKKYWEECWDDNMKKFECMRDKLSEIPGHFLRLDAAQLVKHAFGLRTQAKKLRLVPVLAYLYAEPADRHADEEKKIAHRKEIKEFAQAVAGDEVRFVSYTYRDLLSLWQAGSDAAVRAHAQAVLERYRP